MYVLRHKSTYINIKRIDCLMHKNNVQFVVLNVHRITTKTVKKSFCGKKITSKLSHIRLLRKSNIRNYTKLNQKN